MNNTTTNGTEERFSLIPVYTFVGIILVSVVVCVLATVLQFIRTIKSHCCDLQYSRKQRIFLYLLLSLLGDLLTILPGYLTSVEFPFYIFMFFNQLALIIFCWAVLHLSYGVFTSLRRIAFRCQRPRCCTAIEDVAILTVVTAIACGWTALIILLPTHGHPHQYVVDYSKIRMNWIQSCTLSYALTGLVTVISAVSLAVILVQLCLAYRDQRIQSQQLLNGLKQSITETVILTVYLLIYFVVVTVAYFLIIYEPRFREVNSIPWILAVNTCVTFPGVTLPFGFILSFGQKMLSCRCCCGQYRRRRRYEQIPVPVEGGVPSIQSPVPTTTMTYYTCDDTQPSEWFQAAPAAVTSIAA